jgi:signal transduction histidine kinase
MRRLVLLVASCALGAVAAALAGAAVDLPPRDALHLAWLAGGAGLVVGCAGGLGVHLLKRRSLAANLAWIAVVSVGAAAVGAIAAARGSVAGELPDVEVSPPEMARVLRNLLENAIRHTPSDGAVRVEAAADATGAYVNVADACGGIPEDDVDRVFELAFRGEADRRAGNGAGAGLGLTIARGIVHAHRGEISVHNEGDGCRFTVRLPFRPRGAPQGAGSTEPTGLEASS